MDKNPTLAELTPEKNTSGVETIPTLDLNSETVKPVIAATPTEPALPVNNNTSPVEAIVPDPLGAPAKPEMTNGLPPLTDAPKPEAKKMDTPAAKIDSKPAETMSAMPAATMTSGPAITAEAKTDTNMPAVAAKSGNKTMLLLGIIAVIVLVAVIALAAIYLMR